MKNIVGNSSSLVVVIAQLLKIMRRKQKREAEGMAAMSGIVSVVSDSFPARLMSYSSSFLRHIIVNSVVIAHSTSINSNTPSHPYNNSYSPLQTKTTTHFYCMDFGDGGGGQYLMFR